MISFQNAASCEELDPKEIKTEAKPGYESTAISLKNEDYYDKIVKYDKQLAELLFPIWEKHNRKP